MAKHQMNSLCEGTMSNRRKRRKKRVQLPRYAEAAVTGAKQAHAQGLIKPGELYVIHVRHDGWCRLLRGAGSCNCNPEVSEPERVPDPSRELRGCT
jgi:hypothetical protein